MPSEILVLENVSKRRITAEGEEVALLESVDLRIEAGSFTAIVGPSGGGKSTLVRMLNRLDDPSEGRILFKGRDLADIDPLTLRRQIGLVLQKPYMFDGTVRDNLQRPFRYGRSSEDVPPEQRLLEILDICQLPGDLLDRTARNLSIGQQHRLSLARTLLLEPEVVLLDEPTSALDRPTADRLGETLRRIGRRLELTIVMVTHDLRLAGRVAERLAYIERGRLLEHGETDSLLAQPQTGEFQAFLADPVASRKEEE